MFADHPMKDEPESIARHDAKERGRTGGVDSPEGKKPLKIGNAQGFWGDSADAPARLVAGQPDLDYLTLDYLAEVSLSILALQRDRDPTAGYARDFLDVIRSLVPFWRKGSKLRLVTNAGGLNPRACAEACAAILKESGCGSLKMGMVTGDDVLPTIKSGKPSDILLRNLETQEPLGKVAHSLVTANAYLGADGVAEAIRQGADIVLTGRVADPSMAVGPCLAHFGWASTDYDRIAGATIAGHLIECGAQVCGGISTHWLELPDPANIGFPVVEVADDGSCVVTKPKGTGGHVNLETVKEQLLYEIGDPGNYLSPDVTVSFLSLQLEQVGNDRVLVRGANGRAPVDSYKVSATYREGFTAQCLLTIFGRDAAEKAKRCGEIVFERVRQAGFELDRTSIECLGNGAVVPGVLAGNLQPEPMEVVLRLSVADRRREALDRFAKEIFPLVTAGPQGITGYSAGRPSPRAVFGYWPCLIEKSLVQPKVEILEV
ncbi:MAG: acyclic terpene utilization AtuA family protein [Planctomycetota bacterium]